MASDRRELEPRYMKTLPLEPQAASWFPRSRLLGRLMSVPQPFLYLPRCGSIAVITVLSFSGLLFVSGSSAALYLGSNLLPSCTVMVVAPSVNGVIMA